MTVRRHNQLAPAKPGLLVSPACVPENSNQTHQPTPVERFVSILSRSARRGSAVS